MSKIIEIKVRPKARREEIVERDGKFNAYVNASPEDGKANKALINLISEYFDVRKQAISIIKGAKSRTKIVEIMD